MFYSSMIHVLFTWQFTFNGIFAATNSIQYFETRYWCCGGGMCAWNGPVTSVSDFYYENPLMTTSPLIGPAIATCRMSTANRLLLHSVDYRVSDSTNPGELCEKFPHAHITMWCYVFSLYLIYNYTRGRGYWQLTQIIAWINNFNSWRAPGLVSHYSIPALILPVQC